MEKLRVGFCFGKTGGIRARKKKRPIESLKRAFGIKREAARVFISRQQGDSDKNHSNAA